MNPYDIDTVEDAAIAIREHRVKSNTLHDGRMRANDEMRKAIAHHEFMVQCTNSAERELGELTYRLRTLISRDAQKAIEAV